MTIEARIERAIGLALLYELNRARSGPTDAVGLGRAWESGGGAADEIRAIARGVIEGVGSSVDVASLSRKLFREAPLCVGDAIDAAAPWTRPGATFRDWCGAEKVRARLAEAAREKAEALGVPSAWVIGEGGEDPIVIAGASERAFVRELGLAAEVLWPEALCHAGSKTVDAIPTWEAAAAAGPLCSVCGIVGAGREEKIHHGDTETLSSEEKKADFGKMELSTLDSKLSTSSGAGARCVACETAWAAGADFPAGDRVLWVALSRPIAEGLAGGEGAAHGLISRTRGRARAAETWRAVHAGLMTFLDGPFAVWIESAAIHFVAPARRTLRALTSSRGIEWLFESLGRTALGTGVALVESPAEVPLWRLSQMAASALQSAVMRAHEVRGEFVATRVVDRPEFVDEPLVVKREDWRTLTLLGSKLGSIDRRTRRHLFATLRGSNGEVDLAFRYEVARSPRLAELALRRGVHEVFGRTSFPQRVAWAENVSEEGGR